MGLQVVKIRNVSTNVSGAGMTVWRPRDNRLGEYHIHDRSWHLKDTTIFQCEMYAIKKAAEWLHANYAEKNIKEAVINTDSESSLHALNACVTTSSSVKETVFMLNMAAQYVKITLRWVKAHDENRGNDRADRLAKSGAKSRNMPEVPDLPKIPLSIIKGKVNRAINKLWTDEWQQNLTSEHNHRQTKDWRPKPDARKARELLRSDRLTYSRKVSAMTGHGPFYYHDWKCGLIDWAAVNCDRCDMEVPQDAKHIFTECPAFANLRRDIFKNYAPQDLTQISDHQLERFIAESNFQWWPQAETPLDALDPG